MKKIISLFAVVSMVLSLSTSAFAANLTRIVEGEGVSLEGTTITYDSSIADGFVFKIKKPAETISTLTINVLVDDMVVNKGWTVSSVVGELDGEEGEFYTESRDTEALYSKTQSGWMVWADAQRTNGLRFDDDLDNFLIFKLTPGADAVIDGASFSIEVEDLTQKGDADPMYTLNNIPVVYTIKEKKTEAKVEATTDAVTGVTTVTYPEGQTGALAGKKIALGTVSGSNVIDADTKISVSYNGGETKIFDGLLAALGVTDSTTLTVGDIQFGVVYDDADGIADAKLFTFALVTE